MFHKPKVEDETDEKQDKEGDQDAQAHGLSIEDEDQQHAEDKDETQMAQDTNAKQKDTSENQQKQQEGQQQQAQQQDTQARQPDIPGGAGAYRGSQQIPNAERMQQQPGAPASAPYAAAAAQQPAQADNTGVQTQEGAQGRRLVVGQGITMSGEIEACDHLVVEGTVEAALKGASVLEISETGVFYGSVEIDEAVVAGRFEGELSVNGRLSVRSTGSVTGTISYKELAVEAGALLDGKITPLKGEQSASGAKGSAQSGQQKESKAKKGSEAAGEENSGGEELPFSNEAKKDNSAA